MMDWNEVLVLLYVMEKSQISEKTKPLHDMAQAELLAMMDTGPKAIPSADVPEAPPETPVTTSEAPDDQSDDGEPEDDDDGE